MTLTLIPFIIYNLHLNFHLGNSFLNSDIFVLDFTALMSNEC